MNDLLRISIFSLIFCLLQPGTAGAACDPNELNIRFGGYFDAAHFPRHRASGLLKSAVDTELQGRACLSIVNDETRFKGSVGMAALRNGEIDLMALTFATLGNSIPSYRVYELPFAFRDLQALEKFQVLSWPIYQVALDRQALIPLGFWHGKFNQLASLRPGITPSDVAGMKFRSLDVWEFDEQISAFIATAQKISDNDLSLAIKSEKVQAIFGGWQNFKQDRSAEKLGHVSEINHSFEGYQLTASKKFWNGVEPNVKKRLAEIFSRISRQVNFETTNRELGAKRSLIRAGTPVFTLTNKQWFSWRSRLQPLWDGFSTTDNTNIIDQLSKANAAP